MFLGGTGGSGDRTQQHHGPNYRPQVPVSPPHHRLTLGGLGLAMGGGVQPHFLATSTLAETPAPEKAQGQSQD